MLLVRAVGLGWVPETSAKRITQMRAEFGRRSPITSDPIDNHF